MYPSFLLGAQGAIAAVLTAMPDHCVRLWNATKNQDHAEALGIHKRLLKIWNAIDAPNLPANVRSVMKLQGRDGGGYERVNLRERVV